MTTEKCRVCSGKMSKPKPVIEGPRKGHNRIFCMSCSHSVYLQPGAMPAQPMQWQQFSYR